MLAVGRLPHGDELLAHALGSFLGVFELTRPTLRLASFELLEFNLRVTRLERRGQQGGEQEDTHELDLEVGEAFDSLNRVLPARKAREHLPKTRDAGTRAHLLHVCTAPLRLLHLFLERRNLFIVAARARRRLEGSLLSLRELVLKLLDLRLELLGSLGFLAQDGLRRAWSTGEDVVAFLGRCVAFTLTGD